MHVDVQFLRNTASRIDVRLLAEQGNLFLNPTVLSDRGGAAAGHSTEFIDKCFAEAVLRRLADLYQFPPTSAPSQAGFLPI